MRSVGIVVLAAGASSRLGTPKQLLRYRQQTLLENSLAAALECKCDPVVLVIGAHADAVRESVSSSDVHIVVNSDWATGISSSLRTGVQEIVKLRPDLEGVVVTVCDQPRLDQQILDQLVGRFSEGKSTIIASRYAATAGVPALFDKTFFAALCELQGDSGARSIIKSNRDCVTLVDFPGGELDIDTPADYQAILASS